MSGSRGTRSSVVIRLTENEALRLEQRLALAPAPDFGNILTKVRKARQRVQAKWQRYRATPIKPLLASRLHHVHSDVDAEKG